MPVIIHYAKTVYDNKVNKLEGYIGQLDNHLGILEGYRDRIKNYWDDDEGRRYYNLVNTEIHAVRNARLRAQSLRDIYYNAMLDLKKSQGLVGGLLDEAESVLGSLGIGGN